MRPAIVDWCIAHGLPGWLVPNYFILVGVSSLVAAFLALWRTHREGAPVHVQARGLLVAYVAALVGGYLFESLRALPTALATGSLSPILNAGRSAYGGLLSSMLLCVFYLRRGGHPTGAFFDRVSIGTGIIFACVRTGCFLAGCDYGRPSAAWSAVRFPPYSLAALDHEQRGWVPAGFPSLPVHPTELYEAALGLLGAGVAWLVLRRARRDGSAFLAFLATYALGRFCLEHLRGDAERGIYLGLSTAQYVSAALLTVCVVMLRRNREQEAAVGARIVEVPRQRLLAEIA